jgi:glycosyltransferase involved in cell wall biosynthesis
LGNSPVKEGWGLIVTEAASQGTPAVVYDIDGLRDSVRHEETGLICRRNTPEDLAKKIVEVLSDKEKYEKMRCNAWQWSKEINFEKSYRDFWETISQQR